MKQVTNYKTSLYIYNEDKIVINLNAPNNTVIKIHETDYFSGTWTYFSLFHPLSTAKNLDTVYKTCFKRFCKVERRETSRGHDLRNNIVVSCLGFLFCLTHFRLVAEEAGNLEVRMGADKRSCNKNFLVKGLGKRQPRKAENFETMISLF